MSEAPDMVKLAVGEAFRYKVIWRVDGKLDYSDHDSWWCAKLKRRRIRKLIQTNRDYVL